MTRAFGFAVASAAALLLLASAPTAAAQEDELDPAYPLTSWLGLFEGLADDVTDAEKARWLVENGVVGVVPRAVEQHPELTDPASLTPESGAQLLQDGIDGAVHSRPTLLGSNILFVGDPNFSPDWNHNGIYGDSGDYDIDNSPNEATAMFRYPCVDVEGTVTYETTAGKCVPGHSAGAKIRTGEVRKLNVINSRGLRMSARLWLPRTALGKGGRKHPGVVFTLGNTSRETDYYVYYQRLARAGYIVMSYAQAGQGDSEGTVTDLDFATAEREGCPFGGCPDVQDAARWFVGQEIKPISTQYALPRLTDRKDPAYRPAGENVRNPVLKRLDTARIGLSGQSLGSVSTTKYLQHYEEGTSYDGRPLPDVKAAVGISGFRQYSQSLVPFQAQTSDYDVPGAQPSPTAAAAGPYGTKAWYDALREGGQGGAAIQMLVFEGGDHLDQSNVNYIPRTPSIQYLSTSYQVDWFDCFLKNSAAGCERTKQPRPHLSKATASEYDFDGPAGRGPSYCVNTPTSATIADPESFGTFAGRQTYDCTVR